ncbi:hypothetical protein SO802_028417 [Lithocarpus litseifolius]|uniref:Growth-regulating factor n=1 Tax=Lithocarpus litseifolius TaxID=425828 RepID=A0AAW2BR87_9ROSI
MDPEPGRCRRIDGKKLRCSKNVVPDQKYCERHMHRGRQHSRKPVEAFKIASPSESTPRSLRLPYLPLLPQASQLPLLLHLLSQLIPTTKLTTILTGKI